MLNDLIPALAVTVVPVLLLLPVVYALRPQGGRHGSLRVPDWLGPYDLRVRQAVRHFADKQREPGLGEGDTVPPAYATADRAATLLRAPACSHGYTTHTNRAGVTMHPNGKPCADRDMTGSFPVVRAA